MSQLEMTPGQVAGLMDIIVDMIVRPNIESTAKKSEQ